MSMPTDQHLAENLLTHLQGNTTDGADQVIRVPIRHYVEPDRAAAERELFARHPLVVAHSSALPAAGSFVTLRLLGVPLLLVRQDDGSVAGFRNICRHRGGRVEGEPSGTKRVFTCRFHGWTYDRDGTLRNVPFESGFGGIDQSCNGLARVGAEDRHGLIWVQLSSTGPIDVAAHLGTAYDEQLAALSIGELTVSIEAHFEVAANWKLVAEGNLDVLHPKFLHPNSVGKLIQSRTHVWERYGKHSRHAMARRKLDTIRDDVDPGADLRSFVITSYFIYPNTWLNVQPTHFEFWSILPDTDSPTATTVDIRYFTPPTPTDKEQAAIDASWDILRTVVPNEDWMMATWIQEGAAHSASDTFIVGTEETPIQHLHQRLAEDLGDPL